MSKATEARAVGETFLSGNGQVFQDKDGRNVREVCEANGARTSWPNGRGLTPIVYLFADGSAIVELDGGWDYRANGCSAHCWDGVGCDCAQWAAEERRVEAEHSARDLIAESQQHDCIAHGEWSQVLEDALLGLGVEDHVTNGDVVEFWGENDDGDWRVHLEKPETDEV